MTASQIAVIVVIVIWLIVTIITRMAVKRARKSEDKDTKIYQLHRRLEHEREDREWTANIHRKTIEAYERKIRDLGNSSRDRCHCRHTGCYVDCDRTHVYCCRPPMNRDAIAAFTVAALCAIKLVWEVATLIRDRKDGER